MATGTYTGKYVQEELKQKADALSAQRSQAQEELANQRRGQDMQAATARPDLSSKTPLLDKQMGIRQPLGGRSDLPKAQGNEPTWADLGAAPTLDSGGASSGLPTNITRSGNTYSGTASGPSLMSQSNDAYNARHGDPGANVSYGGLKPALQAPSNDVANDFSQFPHYAYGGEVDGPPGLDQVPAEMPDGGPARLNDGEFVLPKEYVIGYARKALGKKGLALPEERLHALGIDLLNQDVSEVTGNAPGAQMKAPLPEQMGMAVPGMAAGQGLPYDINALYNRPNALHMLPPRALGNQAGEVARAQQRYDGAVQARQGAQAQADRTVAQYRNMGAARQAIYPPEYMTRPPPSGKYPVVYEPPWAGSKVPFRPGEHFPGGAWQSPDDVDFSRRAADWASKTRTQLYQDMADTVRANNRVPPPDPSVWEDAVKDYNARRDAARTIPPDEVKANMAQHARTGRGPAPREIPGEGATRFNRAAPAPAARTAAKTASKTARAAAGVGKLAGVVGAVATPAMVGADLYRASSEEYPTFDDSYWSPATSRAAYFGGQDVADNLRNRQFGAATMNAGKMGLGIGAGLVADTVSAIPEASRQMNGAALLGPLGAPYAGIRNAIAMGRQARGEQINQARTQQAGQASAAQAQRATENQPLIAAIREQGAQQRQGLDADQMARAKAYYQSVGGQYAPGSVHPDDTSYMEGLRQAFEQRTPGQNYAKRINPPRQQAAPAQPHNPPRQQAAPAQPQFDPQQTMQRLRGMAEQYGIPPGKEFVGFAQTMLPYMAPQKSDPAMARLAWEQSRAPVQDHQWAVEQAQERAMAQQRQQAEMMRAMLGQSGMMKLQQYEGGMPVGEYMQGYGFDPRTGMMSAYPVGGSNSAQIVDRYRGGQ